MSRTRSGSAATYSSVISAGISMNVQSPGTFPDLMKPVGSSSASRCMITMIGVSGFAFRLFTVDSSLRFALSRFVLLYASSTFSGSSMMMAPCQPSAMWPARKPVIWPPSDTA